MNTDEMEKPCVLPSIERIMDQLLSFSASVILFLYVPFVSSSEKNSQEIYQPFCYTTEVFFRDRDQSGIKNLGNKLKV